MNKSLSGWMVVLAVSFMSPAQALDKKSEKTVGGWGSKMHQMASLLSELLVDASSIERFGSPQNAKRIESNSKKLSELAHDIQKTASPDKDLSLELISGLFKDEALRGYQEFKRGNKAYARQILRTIPNYCMGCHTRGNGGPEFAELISEDRMKGLSEYQKAETYASARQYDKALKNFEAVITNSKYAKTRILEWEKASRYAVAIAVRVKKDPKAAIKFVNDVLDTSIAPKYFKSYAETWKESLIRWEKDFKDAPTSESGMFSEAQKLMAQALQTQAYPADRGGEVLYLRATQVLHELLNQYPNSTKVSEALYMLGLAYRALQDLNLWSLSDLYFESCIRRAPRSPIASQCFKQYEESVFIGYSGSGGIAIPADVLSKLKELDSMANGMKVENAQ